MVDQLLDLAKSGHSQGKMEAKINKNNGQQNNAMEIVTNNSCNLHSQLWQYLHWMVEQYQTTPGWVKEQIKHNLQLQLVFSHLLEQFCMKMGHGN